MPRAEDEIVGPGARAAMDPARRLLKRAMSAELTAHRLRAAPVAARRYKEPGQRHRRKSLARA